MSATTQSSAQKPERSRDGAPDAAPCGMVDCMNALFHCWGAAHQFDRLYKDGAFDGCAKPQEELVLCARLRLAGRDERLAAARALLVEPPSPTEGVIWTARPR